MSLFALDHKPTRADFRALLRLAAPLVSIQVGTMLMGVVDTVMVGHVSPGSRSGCTSTVWERSIS